MKVLSGVVLALAVALPATMAWAANPVELESAVQLCNGAVLLDVGSYSAPEVVDWDEDGSKDLVVGQGSTGKISLFLNQGTDEAPIFNGSSFIQSHSADIVVPGG